MFARYSTFGVILSYLPLYAGPVLAGLGGLTAWTVPAFALIFTALILYQKPNQPAAQAVAGVVVNLCLAGILFGIGTALSWATGMLDFPMWAAIGMSAMGAVWVTTRYPKSGEMDALLDTTLEAVEGVGATLPGYISWTETIADPATATPTRLLDGLQNGRAVTKHDLPDILGVLNTIPPAQAARDVSRYADFSDNGVIVAMAWFAQPDVPQDLVSDAELEDILDTALTHHIETDIRAFVDRFADRLPADLVARTRA